MIVIGLTGSIGMGKSALSQILKRWHVPVFDADSEVHRLFSMRGPCLSTVGRLFPGVLRDGKIDRDLLGRRVLGDRVALSQLENIVHPAVLARERSFLRRQSLRRVRLTVLDMPLLFETGYVHRVDHVWVVSAPRHVQCARVMRRRGMTSERFAAIQRQQVPDRVKRRLADRVIRTGLSKRFAFHQVLRARRVCRGGRGAWSPVRLRRRRVGYAGSLLRWRRCLR